MLQIVQTRPEMANFHLFQDLPATLYPPDSARFRLPDSLPTEWLDSCWLLLEDEKPLARATLYHNPHLASSYLPAGKVFCIGTYEAAEDLKNATYFLQHLENEAKKKGASYLIGQMNGSTWENYRFSLHHDSPPFFLEQYHHVYYNAHFEQSGFQIIECYFSSLDQEIKHNAPEVLQWEADFRAKGVTLRSIDLAHYEQELEKVYHFNMLAYQTNFLFSPISQESFIRKYMPLKNLINPALVLFAEDADKNMIGLFFCVEDFWNKNTKTLIVKSIARHPDVQWRGLGHVIGNQICKNALELGYQQMIHAFLRENGTSTSISQNYSGKVFKNYVLYGKVLN